MSPQTHLVPTLRLLSKEDQSPLLSRLTRLPSNYITPVLSPKDLEPDSTTVCSLSDLVTKVVKTTSLSRTHGDHHGEIRATSRSPQINAESPTLPPIQWT